MDIKNLSKDPMEALRETIERILQVVGNSKTTVELLRDQNHPIAIKLVSATAISKRLASRIDDPTIRELIEQNLNWGDEDTMAEVRERTENVLELLTALEVEEHFIDREDVELFDEAELTNDEKLEIRRLMANARALVDRSEVLKEFQRKNVLYHISKIENELHREKSHFEAFLAAAYQVSSLVKQVGKDVEPIAKAIEKARTITEKRVQGQLQIEKEKAPKKLEDKSKE